MLQVINMAKPIGKYDKCGYCGHSEALDHKHSWGTTTCNSCPDRKGCNEKNRWGASKPPIHSPTLKGGVSLGAN